MILESRFEKFSSAAARGWEGSALKNVTEQFCAASGLLPHFPPGSQASSFQFPELPSLWSRVARLEAVWCCAESPWAWVTGHVSLISSFSSDGVILDRLRNLSGL